tara:strand:- start:619 stop:1632 length:1014 start_codon:yes stop_codon:yes gene_type:complete
MQDFRIMYSILKNKKILVTGGAGFIGRHLCEFLINQGAYVHCLDNLSTGYLDNIKDLMNNKRFKFIEGDIRDIKTCINSSKNIDFVLHQAALGSVPRSIKDPILTNSVNIDGFLNMLVASRDNKVKRFVFAASSSTYGDSIDLPKIEEKIGKPLSPYAITKYVNELYADIFSNQYSLEFIGLRYFNVFGAFQDPNGAYAAVIPKFINKMMNFESPIINGDGSYTRDFTYIDNVVLANVLALTTTESNAVNQIYNIACGEQTSLNELFITLQRSLGEINDKILDVNVKYGPERVGDIPHSLASIKKAKKLLNYYPKYSIQDGIKKSIGWYWNKFKKNN